MSGTHRLDQLDNLCVGEELEHAITGEEYHSCVSIERD
jgi:hypothetical protein